MSSHCPTCNKPGYQKADAVITVRLPKELHRNLKLLAADRMGSLNELCVDTLQKEVDRVRIQNGKRQANRSKHGVRSGIDHTGVYDD